MGEWSKQECCLEKGRQKEAQLQLSLRLLLLRRENVCFTVTHTHMCVYIYACFGMFLPRLSYLPYYVPIYLPTWLAGCCPEAHQIDWRLQWEWVVVTHQRGKFSCTAQVSCFAGIKTFLFLRICNLEIVSSFMICRRMKISSEAFKMSNIWRNLLLTFRRRVIFKWAGFCPFPI